MSLRGDIKDEEKGVVNLSSFTGGMRRNVDPSELEDNEYVHGENIRVRDGYIKPVKGPLDISDQVPAGKKQGIYGYGTILVLFNGGKAYAKDFSDNAPQFSYINGFLMNDSVERIYAQDVPASWMNVERKLTDGTDITGGIKFLSEIAGTPAAIVCQDGLNQPRLIFSTGLARAAKIENDWNNSDLTEQDTREYVPVGKQMMYSPDGILYIFSPDSKIIYRSVTGRPLDFVIAVDSNGDKLPSLSTGKPEASRLSYNLDFSPMTAIFNINSTPRRNTEAAGFFVGTSQRSWVVYPTYDQLPYNEPTFSNQFVFSTGPLNQDSVEEVLGETVLITDSGPMTFSAITNSTSEGKNSPFYSKVAKLFQNITQTTTCIGKFDDYVLFSINTLYGQGVLVYDTTTGTFPSLDIYPEVNGVIKQFATIKVRGQKRLFFITTSDQLFEAFAGETAKWKTYLKEFGGEGENQVIPRRFRVTLANITENGTLTLQEFVDRKAGTSRPVDVSSNIASVTPPIAVPFGNQSEDSVSDYSFPIEVPFKGERLGVMLSGDFDCELQVVTIIAELDEQAITDSEAGRVFSDLRGPL